MKTKEKVEQGKGTAGHLMPLGYLFWHCMVRLSAGSVGALCVGLVLGFETRRVGAAYPGPLFLTDLKLTKEFCFIFHIYFTYLPTFTDTNPCENCYAKLLTVLL